MLTRLRVFLKILGLHIEVSFLDCLWPCPISVVVESYLEYNVFDFRWVVDVRNVLSGLDYCEAFNLDDMGFRFQSFWIEARTV